MNNEQEGKVLKRADQVKEQEKNGFCVRVRCAPGNVLCGVSLICTMFEIELFGPEQVYFKQIAMLKDN